MPAVKVRDEGRIQRLITLAYFLSTRSEIHIEELCERLGVDRNQIEADLNVLMFCGLPPYSPEQLFDIMIEDDFVSMYFNDVFIAPLRLTEQEKAGVVIALARLEAQTDDHREREAIHEVLNLIDDSSSDVVRVEAAPAQFDETLRNAIAENIPLEITYLSLSSASLSPRIIEPRGMYTTASVTYVFAYTHDANDFRVFRTDRILDVQPRKDIEPQAQLQNNKELDIVESSSEQLFIENRDSYVDLFVDSDASWILDTYPHENTSGDTSVHRFYTPGPYFAARLIVANQPFIRYVGGTFSREAILEALKTIREQMERSAQGSF